MPKDNSLNRKSKDSVFVKFFRDEKNVLQMYKELHPEATDVTVDDITIETLESVIVNTVYNDLGFLVKDRYIFLVEAQSTWNNNIALRMLFYLSETLRRYIIDTGQSEHDDVLVKLPTPELYVIYSGSGQKPDTLSLSEDFFGGNPDFELKVHVLSKVDETLSGQYIGFCKVFDEQRVLHKDGLTTAKETYRICIEKGYMTNFMKNHEKEVVDMMSELFDEEAMRKQLDVAHRKRYMEQGMKKGVVEGKTATALKLIARGKETVEEIAEDSGLPLDKVKELVAQHKPM